MYVSIVGRLFDQYCKEDSNVCLATIQLKSILWRVTLFDTLAEQKQEAKEIGWCSVLDDVPKLESREYI